MMTERQREEELLSELLDLPDISDEVQIIYGSPSQPVLTRSEEQALLRAANSVGTPTLAPEQVEPPRDGTPGSFVSDLVGVARKHPAVAALAVAGVVFLLARRRRR
jgi:hypothetical protein